MLEKVLKNHYIIIDEQHTVLPKQSNNIFINVPNPSQQEKSSKGGSISSTLMAMSSQFPLDSASSGCTSGPRRQLMLCTNEWINEYYLSPIIGYMHQRQERLQELLNDIDGNWTKPKPKPKVLTAEEKEIKLHLEKIGGRIGCFKWVGML